MPLPTPNLDDRHFQDIVDEAKRLIPYFCPEWTDHNVSDPGVAMIELFAWMTDMLLYRVNQVPDKMFITFLDLIGVRLEEPRPAQAPVTFYLSAAQPVDITIPKDTQVATARTETEQAIIFTSEQDAVIHPAVVRGAFTRDRSVDRDNVGRAHDLELLENPSEHIDIFPPTPGVGDSFLIALEHDHSMHVLTLVLECDRAGWPGIEPHKPPWEWQVYQGGTTRWQRCEIEHDGTGGFNWSGEITLHLPTMTKVAIADIDAYWLRCRIMLPPQGRENYEASPKIQHMLVESRGITTPTRNAVTVRDEIIGISEGVAGQEFRLLNHNLLSRDPAIDVLTVELPGGGEEHWQEVSDFADSKPDSKHYVIDSLTGTLMFGPELPQPNGSVYRFGAVPPKGSVLRLSRYQYGGGVEGNVPPSTLTSMMSSIPYVSQVINRSAAVGGRNAQSLEDAKLRAPQALRTRTRAVTASDYEFFATSIAGVARARCLGPESGVNLKPGEVRVLVVPDADAQGTVTSLPADRREVIKTFLDERKPLGISVDVTQPTYIWVAVQAKLRLPDRRTVSMSNDVRQQAEAALRAYINPYTGGPQQQGWPFGRDLHVSEIYSLLQRVPGVEFVEEVHIVIPDGSGPGKPQIVSPRLTVPPDAVLCSAQHTVEVA